MNNFRSSSANTLNSFEIDDFFSQGDAICSSSRTSKFATPCHFVRTGLHASYDSLQNFKVGHSKNQRPQSAVTTLPRRIRCKDRAIGRHSLVIAHIWVPCHSDRGKLDTAGVQVSEALHPVGGWFYRLDADGPLPRLYGGRCRACPGSGRVYLSSLRALRGVHLDEDWVWCRCRIDGWYRATSCVWFWLNNLILRDMVLV
jgi:hypothetical protein